MVRRRDDDDDALLMIEPEEDPSSRKPRAGQLCKVLDLNANDHDYHRRVSNSTTTLDADTCTTSATSSNTTSTTSFPLLVPPAPKERKKRSSKSKRHHSEKSGGRRRNTTKNTDDDDTNLKTNVRLLPDIWVADDDRQQHQSNCNNNKVTLICGNTQAFCQTYCCKSKQQRRTVRNLVMGMQTHQNHHCTTASTIASVASSRPMDPHDRIDFGFRNTTGTGTKRALLILSSAANDDDNDDDQLAMETLLFEQLGYVDMTVLRSPEHSEEIILDRMAEMQATVHGGDQLFVYYRGTNF